MTKDYFNFVRQGIVCLLLMFSLTAFSQASKAGGGCVDPVISDTSGPGTICEGDSASLTATHDGDDVNWYDAEVGGNLLGTGSPFDTGSLSSTTSFWAEAFTNGAGAPITGGARVAPTNTSNSSVVAVTSPWGLAFNADVDLTINSVDVYIADTSPGSLVIQLKDSGLTILEEITVATPAGSPSVPVQFAISLDWFVPAGTDYNLVAESSPNMVREFSSGHPGFPYPLGSAGTVTNGTINDNDTNANVYYFFYNWTVTPGQVCTSDRVEEVVTVTPAPDAPTGDANQDFTPGETLADLDVTGTNLTWYSDAGGVNEIPETTPLVDNTTYYVSQTVGGCESALLAITVNDILGVSDENLSQLGVYPNPTSEKITITYSREIERVEIYSLLGQLLMEATPQNTSFEWNVNTLATGNYIVRIYSGDYTESRKLVKQ